MNLEKEIFDIEIKDIMPNRYQPREVFNEQDLNEMAQSIKEHGIIQPIVVRKVGDRYEIIAGERRYRASILAGKQTIPAIVSVMDDREAAKVALLENLQRKDLSAIEEAKTYQTILKLDNITQEELAQNLGTSQSAIANKLRLLNLDESVQTALLNNEISERHARSLLNIPEPEAQKDMLRKVIENRMTVRQLDEEITRLTGKPVETEPTPEASIDTPKELSNIEENTPVQKIQNNINEEKTIVPNIPNEVKENNEKIDPAEKDLGEDEFVPFTYETLVNESNNEKLDLNKEMPNNIFFKNSDPNEGLTNLEEINILNGQEEFIKDLPDKATEFDIIDIADPTSGNIETEMFEPLLEEEKPNPFLALREEEKTQENYDMRFAINNFRQAIQNTEKFGFKVTKEEKELENSYQIIINIEKK